jgi:CHAD domain-containing protein
VGPDDGAGGGSTPASGRGPSVTLGPADRSQPAGRVLALILEGFLVDGRVHEPGVLADEDPEELHDLRVAIRRTRSLLRVARDVLPEPERTRLRDELRWLADLTSPVRDLDVLAEDLGGLLDRVQPPLRTGADELQASFRRERALAVERLRVGIGSDRHAELFRLWHLTARVHVLGERVPPSALRPAGEVAQRAILDSERRLRRAGRLAGRSDDLEHWHDLRKALKQFRYVLGALAPLHPPGAFDSVRAELPELQDVLGRLQDHHVQAELVGRLGVAAGGDAALLAGAIADRLHRDAARAHRRCARAWRHLERSDLRARLRAEFAAID